MLQLNAPLALYRKSSLTLEKFQGLRFDSGPAQVTVRLNEEPHKPLVWLKGGGGHHWSRTKEMCSERAVSLTSKSAKIPSL